MVAGDVNPGKSFFINKLVAHLQYWPEGAHQGLMTVGSRKNDKNANKMHSDGSGWRQIWRQIGFNEEERLLYLIAHEHASKYEMLDAAIGLGVKTGGLMDGGSATTLILDGQAKGLRPYTGIRGTRPLGGYLGIRAKSLR